MLPKNWPLLLGVACGSGAITYGLATGTTDLEGWRFAARWSGRISYPLFLIVFMASSAARLFPSGWTGAWLRDRRWWGLGFAACFGLHVVALVIFNALRGRFPPAGLFDLGVLACALLLMMALTSTNAAQRRLGRAWKWLHRAGMGLFLFIYGRPGDDWFNVFTLTAGAALLLRLVAEWKAWHDRAASRAETVRPAAN